MSDKVSIRGIDPEGVVDGDYVVTVTGGHIVGLAASSGGGGSVAVDDEGVETVAAASRLNFTGAGVTVTDAGSGEATVDIPGATSTSSGEVLMQDGVTGPPVPIETEDRSDWLYQG